MNYDLSLNELEEMVRDWGVHLDREYGEYSHESIAMAAKKALDSFRAVAGHLYAHYGNDRDVKIPFEVFKPFLDKCKLCGHYGRDFDREYPPLGSTESERDLPPL